MLVRKFSWVAGTAHLAQPLQSLICPWDEKKVSRTGHDRACAREQHVCKCIAHGPDAELISSVCSLKRSTTSSILRRSRSE